MPALNQQLQNWYTGNIFFFTFTVPVTSANADTWSHEICVYLSWNWAETRLSNPSRQEIQLGLIYRRLCSSSRFTWAPLCLIGLIMWLTWQIYPLPSRHSFEQRQTTNRPKVTPLLKPHCQQWAAISKEVSIFSRSTLPTVTSAPLT